jgi:hypothetical protein
MAQALRQLALDPGVLFEPRDALRQVAILVVEAARIRSSDATI